MSTKQQIEVDNKLIARLKDEVVNRQLKIDLERTDVLAEIYKEYEGQPQIIIRARLLEKLLLTKKIYIDDYEFIGNLAGEFGGFYLYPEWDINWIDNEDTFPISDEEKAKLDEVKEYWKTHSIRTRIHNEYQELREEPQIRTLLASYYVLPALVEALEFMKNDAQNGDNEDIRNGVWYQSLETRLNALHIVLKDETSMTSVANKVLKDIIEVSMGNFKFIKNNLAGGN